ncbi:S-adenosyl-L-methionine-dependent methyltransferase [Haematococcus lacustris]
MQELVARMLPRALPTTYSPAPHSQPLAPAAATTLSADLLGAAAHADSQAEAAVAAVVHPLQGTASQQQHMPGQAQPPGQSTAPAAASAWQGLEGAAAPGPHSTQQVQQPQSQQQEDPRPLPPQQEVDNSSDMPLVTTQGGSHAAGLTSTTGTISANSHLSNAGTAGGAGPTATLASSCTSTSGSPSAAEVQPCPSTVLASMAAAAAALPGPLLPPLPSQRIKVVANLPYNITKEFLKLMLPLGAWVSELSIMIQEEAAVRLVSAKPGDSDYRAMNMRVQLYSKPKYRFKISRFKYSPAPGVDGALVTFQLLTPAQRPQVASDRGFLALVARGFAGRRKMLRNNLQPAYSSQQVESALVRCQAKPTARAQDLSCKQWVQLSHELQALAQKDLSELLPPVQDNEDEQL